MYRFMDLALDQQFTAVYLIHVYCTYQSCLMDVKKLNWNSSKWDRNREKRERERDREVT